MTNPHYSNTETLLTGQLAKGSEVEAKFAAVEDGFDSVEAKYAGVFLGVGDYDYEIFTVTAAQTLFEFTTIEYPSTLPNTLRITVQGARQNPTEYSQTSDTSFTITGLNEGDLVLAEVFTPSSNQTVDSGSVVYSPTGTGTVASTVQSKLEDVISVADFGAVGGNEVLDTLAFHMMIKAVNDGTYSTVRIPKTASPYLVKMTGDGTYDDTYRFFSDIDGLTIISEGAQIKIPDGSAGRRHYATDLLDEAVGFNFHRCTNLSILGSLEINGNVENAVLGTGGSDGWCFGLHIRNCSNVYIENVYLHHFATDGVYIGADYPASASTETDGVTFVNLRCDYNCRQGVSVTGGKNMTFINLRSTNAGQVVGFDLAPRSGFDFEPDTDQVADNITFINPHISGNNNTALVADSFPERTTNINIFGGQLWAEETSGLDVTSIWVEVPTCRIHGADIKGKLVHFYGELHGCSLTADATYPANYLVNLSDDAPFLADSCTFNVSGDNRLFYFSGSTTDGNEKRIRNSKFYYDGDTLASGTYLSVISDDSSVENCEFIHTGTAPVAPYYMHADFYSSFRDCSSPNANIAFKSSGGELFSPMQTGIKDGVPKLSYGGQIEIVSGVLTVSSNYHHVKTEGAAATDDLDTISGGSWGQMVTLRSGSDSWDTTFKHGTGNLELAGGLDFTFTTAKDTITLLFDNLGNWLELSRSTNS